MFARAVWLQGVEAAHLSGLARSQHEETQTIPAGRGTIFDRTGVQLAIGEQKTTIYADPQRVTERRARSCSPRTRSSASTATSLYPQLVNRKSRFVYVKRFADPATAELFLKKGFQGVLVLPRRAAHLPAGFGRGAGARLRGRSTIMASAGSSSSTTGSSPGARGSRPSSATRPAARST